jgi:hypothetical protein
LGEIQIFAHSPEDQSDNHTHVRQAKTKFSREVLRTSGVDGQFI